MCMETTGHYQPIIKPLSTHQVPGLAELDAVLKRTLGTSTSPTISTSPTASTSPTTGPIARVAPGDDKTGEGPGEGQGEDEGEEDQGGEAAEEEHEAGNGEDAATDAPDEGDAGKRSCIPEDMPVLLASKTVGSGAKASSVAAKDRADAE